MLRKAESFSSISCYLECARKYFFRYATEAVDEGSTAALELGKAFHDGLEHVCLQSWQGVAKPEIICEHAKAKKMLTAYVPMLGLNRKLFVESYNDKPALEIPFDVELTTGVRFRGKIDAVLRNDKDQVLLVDWKTRGYFTEGVPAQLDAQLHLYAAAADRLGIRYDRVAQIQFAKACPAMPTLTKKGVPNKKMGRTTLPMFESGLRFWGVDPAGYVDVFADKIVSWSEFLKVSDITSHPDVYVNWFVESVKRAQVDSDFTPVSRSNTCKWCGYHGPCMELTKGLSNVLI